MYSSSWNRSFNSYINVYCCNSNRVLISKVNNHTRTPGYIWQLKSQENSINQEYWENNFYNEAKWRLFQGQRRLLLWEGVVVICSYISFKIKSVQRHGGGILGEWERKTKEVKSGQFSTLSSTMADSTKRNLREHQKKTSPWRDSILWTNYWGLRALNFPCLHW